MKASEKNLIKRRRISPTNLSKLQKAKKEKLLKDKINREGKADKVKRLKLKKKFKIQSNELMKLLPEPVNKDKNITSSQEEIQNEDQSSRKIIKKEKNLLNGRKFKVDLSLKSRMAVKAMKKKGRPKKTTIQPEMQERPIEEQK